MEHRSDAYGPEGRISQPREKYEIRTTIVVIFCIISSIFYPLSRVTSETPEVWQLEVPLLKVDRDTLSTVEVIEQAFGHVRLHETVKATYAFRLVQEHCDLDQIFKTLGISS